jgi:hypothetical protein
MTIQDALVAFLKADTALMATVGNRLYPVDAPQGQGFPRILYTRTHTEDDQTLSASTDQPVVRISVDCQGGQDAGAYAVARDLAIAVKNSQGGAGGLRLKEFRGRMGGVGGVWVDATRLDDESDSPIPPRDGSDKSIQQVSLELVMSIKE